MGTEAVGTAHTPAHGLLKPSAKTGEEGVGISTVGDAEERMDGDCNIKA